MSAGGATAPLVLDTRMAAEFAVSHLRGALRLDPSWPLLTQVGDRGARPIVVYCSVGYRSAVVARSVGARQSMTAGRPARVSGIGLGLRAPLAVAILTRPPPALRWLEVSPENQLVRPPRRARDGGGDDPDGVAE